MMNTEEGQWPIAEIAEAFGITGVQFKRIPSGLINTTFKMVANDGKEYILQAINTKVFASPQILTHNYLKIEAGAKPAFRIPQLWPTVHGHWYYEHPKHHTVWRCFTFVPHSFSPPVVERPEAAYQVAHCFGKLTAILAQNGVQLAVVLPQFHNLSYRMEQLQKAIRQADATLLTAAADCLQAAEKYAWLEQYYQKWAADAAAYPPRILHHDCKISNMLFSTQTQHVICPIDFDTTQSGLFYSDIGDMIRSMVPSHDENESDIAGVFLKYDYLQAIREGYLAATHTMWTQSELEALPLSGQVIVYMQAIRFLTDYLSGSVYYTIDYPQHNLVRAANQFRVLELLAKSQR
jgi:aminoglycoside phosphotransferase (APT) family kinase protein